MHMFSREARERPLRTVEATEVLRAKAAAIERVTMDARSDEVIVAVVQPDLSFGGVWTLAREDLTVQIFVVEDEGGWSLLFSPNTSLAQIEKRCDELAGIARRRGEIMERYVSRHQDEMRD